MLFLLVKSFFFRPAIIRLKIRQRKSRLEYTLYKHAVHRSVISRHRYVPLKHYPLHYDLISKGE